MLPSCHGRPHHTTVSIGIPAAQSWFAPAAAATVHATVAARATWMGGGCSPCSSFVGGETTFSLATTRFSRRIWAFLTATGHHLNDVPDALQPYELQNRHGRFMRTRLRGSLPGAAQQVDTLHRSSSHVPPVQHSRCRQQAQFCHILRLRSLPPEATWRPSGLQSTA